MRSSCASFCKSNTLPLVASHDRCEVVKITRRVTVLYKSKLTTGRLYSINFAGLSRLSCLILLVFLSEPLL